MCQSIKKVYESMDKSNCGKCEFLARESDIIRIPPPESNVTMLIVSRDPPKKYYFRDYQKVLRNANLDQGQKRKELMKEGVPKWLIKRIMDFKTKHPTLIENSPALQELNRLVENAYWTHLCKCWTCDKKEWMKVQESCPGKWLREELKAACEDRVTMVIALGDAAKKAVDHQFEYLRGNGVDTSDVSVFRIPHHSGSNFDWTWKKRALGTANYINELLRFIESP